jgi:hypothetical protein
VHKTFFKKLPGIYFSAPIGCIIREGDFEVFYKFKESISCFTGKVIFLSAKQRLEMSAQ